MLRKLAMAGLVAGGAAYLPFLYERHDGVVQDAVISVFGNEPEPAPNTPALTARRAELDKPKPSGRRVRIEADSRGHFSADFRINGRAVDAMVDTGATLLAINQTTARRIGIQLSPSDFNREVSTANGKIKAATAMLDSVQIGRIEIRDVPAMVLEDKALGGTLVGMSFLSRLASFRVENGAMLIEQ